MTGDRPVFIWLAKQLHVLVQPEDPILGGGIYSNQTSVTLTNSTITGNQAGADGGGIYQQGLDYGEVGPDLTGTKLTKSGGWARGRSAGAAGWGHGPPQPHARAAPGLPA